MFRKAYPLRCWDVDVVPSVRWIFATNMYRWEGVESEHTLFDLLPFFCCSAADIVKAMEDEDRARGMATLPVGRGAAAQSQVGWNQ